MRFENIQVGKILKRKENMVSVYKNHLDLINKKKSHIRVLFLHSQATHPVKQINNKMSAGNIGQHSRVIKK